MMEIEGVVLAQYPTSEHSAMVTLLTEEGKKSFYARGILKIPHPFSALCAVGTLGFFQLLEGKQKGLSLQNGVIKESPLQYFHHPNDLFPYHVILELLGRIETLDEDWYSWFKEIFHRFNKDSGIVILGDGLYSALEKLGIGLNFSSCVHCGSFEKIVDFSPKQGGLVCIHCAKMDQRQFDLNWIKSMIQHFHYHREGIQEKEMIVFIRIAYEHLLSQLNIELKSYQLLKSIH